MRLLGVIGTAVLSLTIVAPAYAQQEQHEQEEQKDKPAQEKEKKAQPDKPAKQEEKNAQQEKNTKQEEKNAQQENKSTTQEEKSQQQTSEATPGKQAQHASAGRIPADRYQAHFGSEHTFRVSQNDYSSGRFQYGGYWFGFNGGWPSNWLYTQAVFVVEIDGMYYLCNPMYPGVNVALEVTL
jgi:DNA mismatch repair ATPase MutL